MKEFVSLLIVAIHCAADELDGELIGDVMKHADRLNLPEGQEAMATTLGASIARLLQTAIRQVGQADG